MDNSLIIKNLNKSYDNLVVFRDINFKIEPGSIINLTGPNGSGKTTLMKIISSQILDYDGEVLVGNKNIIDFDIELFNLIYYVPPYSGLYEHLTLNENVNFFLSINNISADTYTEELIRRLSLNEHLSKKVHELSDGTTKKASILLLFLINPDFFILDEPFTYLDDESSETLIELIISYQKKGKSFLIADNSLASRKINFNGVVQL